MAFLCCHFALLVFPWVGDFEIRLSEMSSFFPSIIENSNCKAKSRKYQGAFEVKSRVKTWQVRGIWSQQLDRKQVPQWGTEPGVTHQISHIKYSICIFPLPSISSYIPSKPFSVTLSSETKRTYITLERET